MRRGLLLFGCWGMISQRLVETVTLKEERPSPTATPLEDIRSFPRVNHRRRGTDTCCNGFYRQLPYDCRLPVAKRTAVMSGDDTRGGGSGSSRACPSRVPISRRLRWRTGRRMKPCRLAERRHQLGAAGRRPPHTSSHPSAMDMLPNGNALQESKPDPDAISGLAAGSATAAAANKIKH